MLPILSPSNSHASLTFDVRISLSRVSLVVQHDRRIETRSIYQDIISIYPILSYHGQTKRINCGLDCPHIGRPLEYNVRTHVQSCYIQLNHAVLYIVGRKCCAPIIRMSHRALIRPDDRMHSSCHTISSYSTQFPRTMRSRYAFQTRRYRRSYPISLMTE